MLDQFSFRFIYIYGCKVDQTYIPSLHTYNFNLNNVKVVLKGRVNILKCPNKIVRTFLFKFYSLTIHCNLILNVQGQYFRADATTYIKYVCLSSMLRHYRHWKKKRYRWKLICKQQQWAPAIVIAQSRIIIWFDYQYNMYSFILACRLQCTYIIEK